MTHEAHKRAYRMAAASVLVVALATALLCVAMVIAQKHAPEPEVQAPRVEQGPPVGDAFYALLIGSDSRKGTALYTGKPSEHAQVDQHADVMTLVRVDPFDHAITLLSIPRDTAPGGGSKINDSLLSGNPEDVVAAAEALTGVSIDYYFMTNFIDFENLVDGANGVVATVPKAITVPDPSTGKDVRVAAGEDRLLDGSEALVLSRARKEYENDQDAIRQFNVRAVEESLIRSVLGGKVSQEVAFELIEAFTVTNMESAALSWLIADFVEHADEVVVYSGTGPYAGFNRESDGLWTVPEDLEAWAALMQVVDEGGDPSAVVPLGFADSTS